MEIQNYNDNWSQNDNRNTYSENNSYMTPPEYNRQIPPLKPTTWLWQAIAVTLCCSPIFGIIGIVFAAKVNSLYYSGLYEESEKASKRAKMWVIIGFVFGIIATVLYTIFILTNDSFMSSIEQVIDNNASGYNY